MIITICGSILFYEKMLVIKKELEALGHKVKLPPDKIETPEGKFIPVKEYYELRKTESENNKWVWKKKREAMINHFKKIEESDAILVLNYKKRGINGYVGANTLLEMGLALFLNKKIYLINNIPSIDYKEEILGMQPTIIKELKEIEQ